MSQEIEYDQPTVATFSPLRSKDAEDPYRDLINNIGSILSERKLIKSKVVLPKKEKLVVNYPDYAFAHPIRLHPSCWVDDGDHLAGVHPKSSLPFFINSSGSIICRLCTGKNSIEEMHKELKEIWFSVADDVLLRDGLSFLMLLEEMNLIEFVGRKIEGTAH